MASQQAKDTWSVFKIMGEFVEGFETLRPLWPSVSIFGSARVGRGHRYYRDAVAVAEALGASGYSVITGGGPGIMKAANKGAQAGDGRVKGGCPVGGGDAMFGTVPGREPLLELPAQFPSPIVYLAACQGLHGRLDGVLVKPRPGGQGLVNGRLPSMNCEFIRHDITPLVVLEIFGPCYLKSPPM